MWKQLLDLYLYWVVMNPVILIKKTNFTPPRIYQFSVVSYSRIEYHVNLLIHIEIVQVHIVVTLVSSNVQLTTSSDEKIIFLYGHFYTWFYSVSFLSTTTTTEHCCIRYNINDHYKSWIVVSIWVYHYMQKEASLIKQIEKRSNLLV